MLNKYNYNRIAFGDALKSVCQLIRIDMLQAAITLKSLLPDIEPNVIGTHIYKWQQLPKHDAKDRLMLQDVGTQCRKWNDDIWINIVKQQIHNYPDVRFAITDCRRVHEFESFKDFVSIYIDCSDDVIYKRLKKRDGYYDVDILTHEAEREIPSLKDKCDFIVYNDQDFKYLEKQVKDIINIMKS